MRHANVLLMAISTRKHAAERARREDERQKRWEAMVAIFPVLLVDGQRHNPTLAARLTREAAEALLTEHRKRFR